MYRSTNPITNVGRSSRDIPSAFIFEQNYPNPFNPSTTIRYATPQRSHVTLIVYNTLGQQVATLVNGEVRAGYHEATFNAEGLAIGRVLLPAHGGELRPNEKAPDPEMTDPSQRPFGIRKTTDELAQETLPRVVLGLLSPADSELRPGAQVVLSAIGIRVRG